MITSGGLINILILNWRDIKHPLSGGAEISLFEHAKYWKQKGANVVWLASYFKGGKKEEEIEGIKILRMGSHYTIHLLAIINYLKGKLGKPDIVIDSFHFIPFFTPFYAGNSKIIALINEPAKNAWFKNVYFPLNLIGYIIEPLFFPPYREVTFITGSESIYDELKNYGINEKHLNIVHHGVYTKKIDNKIKKDKDPVVIYLSQISPDKGIEDAIKALVEIKFRYNKVKLWVVGRPKDNKYLEKIKKLVGCLKLDDSVIFWGYISENEKFKLLNKSWILIHPSIREGWGLNVIEANAMGVPAVGYNTTGLRDSIKNNVTGLLAKNNSFSLAKNVVRLISDKKMYNRMSNKAMEWSKTFDWRKSGEKSWAIIAQKLKQ